MKKNLLLYALLMIGLMSCNLDYKLSSNKGQKNNNDVKEFSDSVQEDAFNNLYSNQEKQKVFTKNFGERKYKDLKDLIVPVESGVPLESLNNRVGISNISIGNVQKKEDLIPYTNEEKKADEAIKYLENILGDSGFSELIKNVCVLKDEYALIKDDFYDVMGKIQNKQTLLMENYKNNRDKIRRLAQLQNEFNKQHIELDQLINKINMAENEIRSAAFFFDSAQKRLKESIIKRLERKKNASYALQLSRQAQMDASSSLINLEASSLKRNEALGSNKDIKELIENAKTVLAGVNGQ
ncbi:P12 family lipoprotein [Borreliella bavariensis]|uniref:P12 family lipoprotein n=1 Tax=Borreliella bavariensis TaxID=664662 RepID=UPI001C0182F0|nr:P12 family lipoprotein [Borreliella bavariensis]